MAPYRAGFVRLNDGNMVEVTSVPKVYFKEDGSVAYKDATGEHA
jgi:hypothetical protein